EILDREDGAKHGLQSLVLAPALRLLNHQELIVRLLLNLDEVRHLGHFVNLAEHFPQTLVPIRSLLRHFHLLARSRRLTGNPAWRKRRLWRNIACFGGLLGRSDRSIWGPPGHLSTH